MATGQVSFRDLKKVQLPDYDLAGTMLIVFH